MADWWEKYKKDRNLGGNKKSSSKRTWLKKEVSVTDENRQTAKSSTWWEDYKKRRDLDSKVAANRQRAERSQRFESANRQLEENRSRDAAEDEIRGLFRNPFSTDAEWQAGVLQRNAERYKRDLPLYQQALQNASTWGEYFSAHRQAGESQSAVKHQFERYQQAAQKAEQDRNESNLVNRPAQWQAENLTPQEIEQRLAYYRSEAATPTVTDKDREAQAYLYPEAALQKDPHGARFNERLLEGAGQDVIDAAYRPILTEQEKAAVEEADRQIIEEKSERNYEQVQRLLAAQKVQTEAFSRARGNELIEEIAQGGEAANKAKTGKMLFEQQQARIAADTDVEIKDDLESSRGAYTASQKERQKRGYILGYDWDNVPEDRKQAVYALYADDPKKAIELAKYYIADVRQAEDKERQEWYAQSGWTAALGLVSSAAAHLGAAVDPFGEVGQELTRRGDNALAGGSQWADAATGYQKIPEWVPVVGGKGAGDLYQTVGSVVQSAAVAAPAILAGRYDQAAAEVLSKLGLALMGSSAAASDYRESVAAGMDEGRAKLHALAAGVEEALFEEVSLDKLIKMDTSGGLKAALKNWLVQSGIEGSEELSTSIANRITDEMISGAWQSKVERRASELIANGMSSTEAHNQAESEWMTDTLYDGFSGFLSGGMMTGGNYALQGLANLKYKAVNAAETRKAQKQAGAAVSRSEGSVEALQAYAKDKGIEIKTVETAEQNAEQDGQETAQNSYSSRDYRSISDTNSKVTQSIRNDLRGKTVQEQQAVRDSLVEKYGEGIAPVVNNAISIETAARVRQEYGSVDSIQAARNQAVSEIKDESLRRAVSDGYDSAAYSLAASQGGEAGMNTMSRYIQQRRNTGSGSEMSMNATVTAQDGSTKSIAIAGMSEDGKRVSLADGSEVAVKDLQADADTTSAIQQLADLDLGDDATKVLQAYQQSGVAGTEGYRWLMDYATAYNQGRTRQISLEQAAQRSSLDERTVMDAYTLGQQAANRETQAGLEKLKNLPKRKGASGRTASIDTTEIKGKTMSKSELEQFELANQYAQALGVDMKWFSSKEKDGKFVGKNGAYENGKIYMDIHAGRNFAADLTSGILATMGHELTHFQQQYAPEEYQAIKEFLFEQIVKSSPNGEARLERLIWEKQRRSGYTLSRKAAEDEVVADACQKMLRDSKAVHDFASQQPEAANGVVRWLDKWFKKVRSIFGRGGNYSEEAQIMDSLEQDVKAAFGELWDKALKQATKVHNEIGDIEGNADQYSLRDVDPVEPSSDAWSRSATFAEVKEKHPTLFALDADESDTRNPTQVKVTVSTYRKIYNMLKAEGFNGTILDASSGLGLGTETGRKEFGFDVDDIEPFPDKSYKPMYTDYSTLDKTYDVVISNAVLNVIPQDLRDAMVVKIGEMLKPGGRAFINVRGDDVLNAGSKVAINEKGMEYFISNTGSYQKGFTRNELKAYLEDALGDGFTVKIRKDFGKVSAEVIRDGSNLQHSDRDAEYLELAKDPEKNESRLQEMVDEAAESAGYTIKAYHGTTENFTQFSQEKQGQNHKGYLEFGAGFYFTPSEKEARNWAERGKNGPARAKDSKVMAVYLNPGRIIEADNTIPGGKEYLEGMGLTEEDASFVANRAYRFIDYLLEDKGYSNVEVQDRLKAMGFDAVEDTYRNRTEGQYVVFAPEQVKSADPVTYDDSGNVIPLSERFNEANEDIRYSERDELASDNQIHDITDQSGETVGVQDGNGHLQFSQRTWRESGKEKMQEYLDERVRKYEANHNDPEGMHPDDAKALMAAVQEQYDALDEIVRQQPGNYKTYEEWADAEVETDIFGNPVFSWLKANGDYGISGDASLICVKRRTLDAVFDYMIQNNMIQDGPEGLKLAQESIVAINDIIRAHGFETACSTCYIDARRYRAAIVAGSFCNVYNKLVRSMLKGKTGIPINAFNFGGNKSVTPLANSLDTLSDSEINWDGINKAIRDQEAKWKSKGWEKFTEDGEEKWRRNGTVKNLPTSGTTEYRIALALKEKPSLRKLALRSDFLSGNGFLELNRTNKDILTLYNVKKGQAGPKATETDIQYLHEALENSFITPERMFKAGGFRLQSFSDYVPRLVFDYVEIIGDLAAKGVPAHMYTKEILCVLQHGLTGTKINMSLIPAMVKKGIAPGLDADGNYLWRDGQTFGSTAYSLSPKLEAHLSKILGYQVKGRLTGAQGFELAKLIQNDPVYGKNNGTIAIGVSEAQIRKMLDDADIRMVIPYHKSGLNHILASMMEIPGFENYESYQNTLKWNGTKWSKVDVDFDFNEAVQKNKGDARAAAQDYLDWCEENGYKPKFSGVASGSARNSYNKAYDFTQHADWQTGTMTGEAENNYYKVLADFTCYDADGKVSRQEAVKLNYPGTDSAFGSMKQLIEMGLESDAMLQAKQDAEVPKIVADIVREIPKFEAAGRNMKAYAQLKENVEGRQMSERDNAKPRSAQAQRDAGYKLSESKFYSLYSAHKLNMTGKGNVQEQISSIMTNGFKGDGGFGNNVMPTNISYDVDENGKRIPRGLSAQKYAPKKGEYILLVPKEGVEVKGGRYNFTERVKPGYKPAFDYEIVQADYDGQPYYEMYERAYDKSQAEKADVTLDGAQFSERDISKIQDEYEEALAAGDSDWQKMLVAQAAYNAGYTTGAYHGSPITDITEFNTRSENTKKERLQLLFGTHFTQNKEYAKLYAKKAKTSKGTSRMSTKTGRIYDVYLDLGKSLDLWTAKNYTPGTEMYSLYEDLPDRIKRKVKPHTFTAYDTEIGLGSGNYISASTIERALQEMAPKEATGFLVDHGYNSVLYLADYSTGMANNRMTRDPSIIMLDPERIKSADPITRSQDGNIIPLTERFNPAKKDIRYSERDYSTPSDEELLMNARVEDAANVEQGRELKDYQALGERIATLEKQLAEAKRQTQLTNRALNTRGIGNVVKTVMRDYDITDARHNGTAKNATLALTDGYQKALDLLDKGASPAEVNDAVYNGAVKAAEIILEQGTYSQNLGGKWQVYSASRYLGENSQELIDSFVSEAYADFVSNRYREARPETAADRLVARTKKEAQERVDKYKGRSDALAEANRRLEEKAKQAETEAKEARKAAGELFLEIKDLRQELMDNKTMSEQERKAASKKLKALNKNLEAKREEATSWQKRAKRNASLLKSALESKNRDISALNNRLSKEQAAALEKQKSLEAKLEKQIQKYRDILAGKANSPELNKLLKAEREKAEARVKEQKKQVFQNYKDRKNRTAIRNRIKNLHAEMSRDLLRPREGHFVPEKLIRPVVDLLDLVNTETNRAKSESAQARIAAINAAYDAIKKDERYSQFYDETIKDMLVELSGTLAGRSIYDLTTAELEDVYTVMKAMRTTIRNAIKADLIEKGKEIWEIGNEMRLELRAGRGAHALQLLEKYHMTMLSAKRAFNRFGGYQQSSAWNKVYRMLDDAQLKMLALEMQGTRIFDRVLEGKENLEKAENLTSYREDDLVDVGLKDETGKAVPIPRGMMLSLYMHLQNEENMRHLMYGGITLPDFKRYYKGRSEAWGQGTVSIPALGARVAALDELFSKGELSDAEYEEAYKEHKAEIDEIFDSIRKAIEEKLTDYDRQWISASREFFDGFSRRELNRVTNEMYGFSKARVDNYFPIVTDSDFLKSEFESISKNISLENAGFMKERVRASNPIYLEDITKAVNRQISNVSRYAGLTQALKTFGNVYNVQDRGFTDSVKKAMAKTYGKNGQQYVENLITDMVGGRNTPGTIFDRVKGNYAQAVLAANLSVTIKQAASFPTAAATVGWGPLIKALARGGKSNLPISRADSNLISIYSPLLWYRSKGAIDVEIGDIANGRDWTQKAKWLMGWIEKTDRATVGRLWYAAEYYVKDNYNLEKGTEEQIKNGESPFYRKVAEVFADIVEDTQPNYTILQRPDILRNPNKLVRAMVMFSTQRFQNGNILIDAIGEYRAMVRADKQNGTPQTKTARKAARQKLTRAISSQTVSAMVLSAMTLLAGAVMHRMNPWRDDDDELTFESIAEEYLNGFLSSLIGSFLAGSEVYEGLQAMLTGSKYYGNDVGGISTINELATSVIQFEQQAVKLIGDEDSTAKDWQNLAEKQLWKVGEYLSQMTGIPTANIKKIIEGGRNHIADIMNEEFFSFEAGVDRSTAVNARRYYKAWMAGDNAKVRDVLKEMRDSGKSEDSIKNAISKQAKTAYEEGNIDIDQYAELLDRSGYWDEEKLNGKVLDIVRDEYVAGARTEKETVGLLIRYNAKVENEDDAWKKVREWNAKKEHADEEDYSYSQYEAIDEAIDANKDIGALVKELTDHGVEENNVRKHVKKRLVDNYIGGNVTESALRNQLSRYCGIVAKADVDKIVNDANCQKQFGVSYSGLDEEYRAGNVSKADMKSALVRYGNMSSADADKKLRWYDLQKQNPDMDITEGVCNSWYDGSSKSRENGHESAKAAGMSIEAYLKAKATLNPIKDQNGNDTGEDEYIAALTKITWLTPRQKDALYYEKYKGTTKYSHKTW